MKDERVDLSVVKWSRPMTIKELSQIFDVHRNTLSKWLKEQVITNRKLSSRRWEIAEFEFPKDFQDENILSR